MSLFPTFLFCQFNFVIENPIIQAPTIKIYLSENGNDNQLGDSLTPLKTFSEALKKIENLTVNQTGETYSEVVLFPGNYHEIFRQPVSYYEINNRKLNVSLRGIENVFIDGTNLNIPSGGGLIYLLGSNISVQNISISQSNENGIRFGYNYNGKVINSHDILIDEVEVSETKGHGILLGIGALNANGSNILIPKAKRFKITNCHIHNSVNYNTAQNQWGSALKFWNTSQSYAVKNHIHDNSGEGIDFDFCDSAIISENKLHDNYANIYLDKMQGAIVEKNLIYNENKVVSGILLGIEAFTAFITNHYLKDIVIENNIILNTMGVNIWQGIYGAIQNASFTNIQIRHNTIIGKQKSNGALVSFSYETIFGNPVPNISFSNLMIERNIISANPDSLNNNLLMSAPLSPQPALITRNNLFNMNPGFGFNLQTDKINLALPLFINPNQTMLQELTPDSIINKPFYFLVDNSVNIPNDYTSKIRFLKTNVGALEISNTNQLSPNSKFEPYIFPNPSTDFIEIRGEMNGKEYFIYTQKGDVIIKNSYKNKIDIERLKPGVYYIHIAGFQDVFTFYKQ